MLFCKDADWISSRENHLPVFLSAFILTAQSIPAFAAREFKQWNIQVVGLMVVATEGGKERRRRASQ
jgi:hypothetical protein